MEEANGDSHVDIEGTEDENNVEEDSEFKVQIPDEWLPLPFFKLRNVPQETTPSQLQDFLESKGLQVKHIHLEKGLNKTCTAYVRLVAPQLEQRDDENFPGLDEDVTKVAENAVAQLKGSSNVVDWDGHKLLVDTNQSQVQLFVGNLTEELEEDTAFGKEMEAHGETIRCFVMRNPAGESKGYGFVEYAFPSAATKAKAALDALSQSMRPDAGKKQDVKNGEKQERWDQVKLIRSEWSRPTSAEKLYSRVLYISNLKGQTEDELKEVFGAYGTIKDTHMPKTKSSGLTKGFAFIEYENSANTDAAFRALNVGEHEKLGSILVSFANPAKHFEQPAGNNNLQRQPSSNNKLPPAQTQNASKVDVGNRNRGGNLGRGGRFPSGRGTFAGRQGLLPGRGMPGRGVPPGRGFPTPGRAMLPPALPIMQAPLIDPTVIMQQQQQQQQMQLQEQMRMMQQQMRNEALMMQEQLRRQQAAREQELKKQLEETRRMMQQQQQQAQQQLKMAENKVKQEAEARRRAEEQAKKAAAAQAALAMHSQQSMGTGGADYSMRGPMNKGMSKAGLAGNNYGMVSNKGMNDFVNNSGMSSNPYGNPSFGQSSEQSMYGSGAYAAGTGNGVYGQSLTGAQDASLLMQGSYNNSASGGRMNQSAYGSSGSDNRYGGPAPGMGMMAGAGANGIGGQDTGVFTGQAAGYAMANQMNYNSTGYGQQGVDAMYGGGQGNSALVGIKRDADMTAYGQGGFGMDATGYGMSGMRSEYKRPRY